MLGNEAARAAVAMAERAYRNSESDGVPCQGHVKAKSSAAKIRPERYGDAAQIEDKSITARADSIRAISFIGFVDEEEECRSGAKWRRASVTKVRSLALFTFGTTIASTCGSFARAVTTTKQTTGISYRCFLRVISNIFHKT